MKVTKSISIDDEVWEKLAQIADDNYTSKSEMVQRLILKELNKEE